MDSSIPPTEEFTTVKAAHPPNRNPGMYHYSVESFVNKGKTPDDPLTWKHKEMLAILGTASSLSDAPYDDKGVEIWGVAQCVTFDAFKRADLFFEMHDDSYWKLENVEQRLRASQIPIYMMDKYEEVPLSIKYPLDLVIGYKRYHRTSVTYMLALAYHLFLTTGNPKSVALFGIHMSSEEEYTEQRPCCEYWLGRMEDAGIEIFIADGAIFEAPGLYAYEGYNPAIPKIRERLGLLEAGVAVRQNAMTGAREEYFKQLGAKEECAYWLRAFRQGIEST